MKDRAADRVGDGATGFGDDATEAGDDATDDATEAGDDATDDATEAGDDATDDATDVGDDATDAGDDAADAVDPVVGARASGIRRRAGVGLLTTRRFGPLFLTQFLGAVNDNLFRSAFVGIVAFELTGSDAGPGAIGSPVGLAGALFILPFVLCSAIAGALADRVDKARLIRRAKLAEVVIMTIGGVAVVLPSVPLLIAALVLMGIQSAFFAPPKYAILPSHLHSDELTGGNALVQSATMAAILIGTVSGASLVALADGGRVVVALAVFAIALGGWLSSRAIPPALPLSGAHGTPADVFRGTWQAIRSLTSSRTILLSVLGVSWFWFICSILLTQLPGFVRDVLGAGQAVSALLLATFAIGAALGALLCEPFSGRRVEIGLVPIGALGMAIFAASFALADPSPALTSGPDVAFLLTDWEGLALLARLLLLALFAGLYIVPLYALIQARSDPAEVSRIVALNMIVNALFIVLAAGAATLMLGYGLSTQQLLLVVTAMHVGVVAFIFFEVPEFAMRLVVWLITHSIYRVSADGTDLIPERGPAVLVSNHVSLIDPLIITAKCRRPIRFVMYYKIYRLPFVNFLFRASGAIPIASQREDPALLERAYDEIAATLERGGLIGIFPEGRLSETGEIGEFRSGIERILERSPVPVVPMALSGLVGTFFTRFEGRPLMSRWPRHWLARVKLNVGPPVDPTDAEAEALAARVRSLIVPIPRRG